MSPNRILRLLALSLAVAVTPAAEPSRAQDPGDRNLQTCLTGKYPALCDHTRLTPDQLRAVTAAELRENLRVCSTGKYPALCDHSKLTPEQAAQVRAAERAENLRICSSGKSPALCRHELLTPGELAQVRSAEKAENLRVCLDGRFPALCSHSMLTPDQAKEVAAAEAKAASARQSQSPPRAEGAPPAGSCESGHWIEAIEGDGKIIKLEDGSLWEVEDLDTVTTSIWLPVTEVVVCDGRMINVDDGETAEVTPLTPGTGGVSTTAATTAGGYVIEASADDETFVINGEVFEARTYCPGFERGDRVRFLSGSPFGACEIGRAHV